MNIKLINNKVHLKLIRYIRYIVNIIINNNQMATSYQQQQQQQQQQEQKLKKVYAVNHHHHDQQSVPISINNDDYEENTAAVPKGKKPQTTYTITRTYVSPNGTTKTKTIEYHGDEAKRVSRIIFTYVRTHNTIKFPQVVLNLKVLTDFCLSSSFSLSLF